MFTNNYIKLQYNAFYGLWNSNMIYNNSVKGYEFVDVTGNSVNAYASCILSEFTGIGAAMGNGRVASFSNYATAVYFGTGGTPAKREDYTLESLISSGLTITNAGRGCGKESDGVYSAFGIYVVKNTSDSDITIREVGAVQSIKKSSSESAPVLMERTVLDEPIVIEPGDEKIVTYKIAFNQL